MFGAHSEHDIISLEETATFLKSLILKEKEKETLNKSYAEAHLLEIREYLNRLERYGIETNKKIEDTFKQILQTLKIRKSQLFNAVLDEYQVEREKIAKEEEKWAEREDLSHRVKDLALSKNDSNLLLNSQFLLGGLREMQFELSFNEVKMFNTTNNMLKMEKLMHLNGDRLTFDELIEYLEGYYQLEEPIALNYKS